MGICLIEFLRKYFRRHHRSSEILEVHQMVFGDRVNDGPVDDIVVMESQIAKSHSSFHATGQVGIENSRFHQNIRKAERRGSNSGSEYPEHRYLSPVYPYPVGIFLGPAANSAARTPVFARSPSNPCLSPLPQDSVPVGHKIRLIEEVPAQ